MTRWKVSFIHLILSVLVLCTIAAILVWRWYPPGLFGMAQADRLLLIMAGVDLAIGPALTLVVYQQGKKSLKFDLAVIAVLQVAAMTYGLSTVWQSRPVYLVATGDRFRMVFANEIDPKDLEIAPPAYRKLPWLTVDRVAAILPEGRDEQQELLFLAFAGKDIYFMPAYYAPYSRISTELLANSMLASDLVASLPPDKAVVLARAIEETGIEPAGLRAVPIASSRGDATMLLEEAHGSVVGPVGVDPWSVFEAREARQRMQAKNSAVPR